MKTFNNIKEAIDYSFRYLLNTGKTVEAKKWQGVEAPAPMFETMDLAFRVPMPDCPHDARRDIKPNLAWAEAHFQERIGGLPLNPPPSHQFWPFGQKNNEAFTSDDLFDHTYPERFWPKYAGKITDDNADRNEFVLRRSNPRKGIRFEYGDLNDVIQQIVDDPNTRQAYLPIFFPEDTGAKGGKGRIPCTLGYHFMLREGFLHVGYTMRSCDAFRHFRDDLYMATRLAHHVADSLSHKGITVYKVGMIKFIAYSYHIFESEIKLLEHKLNKSEI
jgi:hypothetical protein